MGNRPPRKSNSGGKATLKQRRNFKEFASRIASEYQKRGKWTNQELKLKETLEEIGLTYKRDFLHNYKLQNQDQTGYYSLDFFLPCMKLVIEVDGSIWHEYFNGVSEKDQKRDKWLKKLGFHVLRIPSEKIDKKPHEVKDTLEKMIRGLVKHS